MENKALVELASNLMGANHAYLRSIGLSAEKIAQNPALLAHKPEALQRKHEFLSSLGLSDKKIASNPQLLGRNLDSLRKNYENLQRYFETGTIGVYAHLLGSNQKTIDDNVEFLARLDIDYHINPLLLDTRVGKKLEKLKAFFKIVLDDDVPDDCLEDRAREFYQQYGTVQTISNTLIRSTNYVLRNRDRLRQKYFTSGSGS